MSEMPPLYTTVIPLPTSLSLSQIYARCDLCEPHTVVLDSGAEPSPRGSFRLARYCFIAQEPFGVLEAYPDCVLWQDAGGTLRLEGDPLHVLQSLLRCFHLPVSDAPTPLPAGALGYLGYGLKAFIEPCPNRLPRPQPAAIILVWLLRHDCHDRYG
jgi:hypothetical protein